MTMRKQKPNNADSNVSKGDHSVVVVLYDVRVGWDLDLCRAAWSNGVDCWV